MENTISKVNKQEYKDRFVAEKVMDKLLSQKNKDLVMIPTEYGCSVDLRCSITTPNDIVVPFNLEIKERQKDDKTLAKYPFAEIKQDKVRRMKEATDKGTRLFYMVLLNESTAYIYDLDKVDWSKVTLYNWWVKHTQVDPNSDYICVPTYMLPYSSATITMDCSDFYTEYYANN